MTAASGIYLPKWLRERMWHPSAWSCEIPGNLDLAVLFIIKEGLFGCLLGMENAEIYWDHHELQLLATLGRLEILSGFLFNSAVQKEYFYSAFNSAMPDNVQFIYGKLIKIHRAGLLVYALISLNQQAIYSAWTCTCCRAIFLLFTCDPLDPDFNTCK